MELFIVDAFTEQIFEGNQAGVVLLDEGESFPNATIMQKIAAELKHSETAFVKATGQNIFIIKYYTPNGEVPLCGHATISAFAVLRNEKNLDTGDYTARTLAGNLKVTVEPDFIWLEMAQGCVLSQLTFDESTEVYQAYGLQAKDRPGSMYPCIVNTGLSDILLPVKSKEKLDDAVQNRSEVISLSKRHEVVGVHMFFYASSPQATAYCRNFAPLYGIDEEIATGTSNGALTYYLYSLGLIEESQENIFIQGPDTKTPSVIKSKMDDNKTIYVGGNAVVSVKGCIKL